MARTEGAKGHKTVENAEAIFDLLAGNRVGMTRREVEDETGMSAQSFTTALAYLKDVMQAGTDQHDPNPLTYTPQSHRYRFAKFEEEAAHYQEWMLRRYIGQANRHKYFTKAVVEKFPESRHAKRIARLHAALAEELEEMLVEVGASE